MEIYRGTVPTVVFSLPTDTTTGVTATYSKNGSDPASLSVVSSAGQATATLPYQDVDGIIKIVWSFTVPGVSGGTYSDTAFYEVVTPVLTLSEIKQIVNVPFGTSISDDDAVRIESATRNVINAHCGQSFGKFTGTYKVRGNNSTELLMPVRLLSIDTVNNETATNLFNITNDGWILTRADWGIPETKSDYHGFHMDNHGVIHNPYDVKYSRFLSAFEYEIKGTWGWDYIPTKVREAARLLVSDYSDADSEYRDRYLTSMTAADWRIQFNSSAFVNTGNVRANQLLADYVLHSGWGVV